MGLIPRAEAFGTWAFVMRQKKGEILRVDAFKGDSECGFQLYFTHERVKVSDDVNPFSKPGSGWTSISWSNSGRNFVASANVRSTSALYLGNIQYEPSYLEMENLHQ